ACGGGGEDAPASLAGGAGLEAQALNATSTGAALSSNVTPVHYVIRGDDWVSAPPSAFQETNTAARSQAVAGTSYYVDIMTGNDKNPGTIDAPWKTLTKASAAPLRAGDALLLMC